MNRFKINHDVRVTTSHSEDERRYEIEVFFLLFTLCEKKLRIKNILQFGSYHDLNGNTMLFFGIWVIEGYLYIGDPLVVESVK